MLNFFLNLLGTYSTGTKSEKLIIHNSQTSQEF